MDDDFSDFDFSAPSVDQLRTIEQLVGKAYRIMSVIDTHEAALKANKAELAELTHKLIPDAMAAAGTNMLVTDNGVKVSIKEVVAGTLPKDEQRRAEALKWLEEHDGKSIIKGSITADFERGEGNLEKKNRCAEALSNLGVDFIESETVHPQTLAAFAREKLKSGEEIPLDLLGLYVGRQAKVTVG